MGINIEEALRRRFAAPLPEHDIRRIIFWQDPEGEFAQMADELSLEGVTVLKLTGSNNFAAKLLLSETDPSGNYLVYNPLSYADIRDDWLLDIELYSEEFRADLVSIRMQECNIPDRPQLRKAVKCYAKFFENKARVARLTAYHSDYTAAGQLHIDILAVLSEAGANTAPGVIRAVLAGGLDMEENRALTQIRKFGNEAAWWELAGRYTGFAQDGESSDLFPLAAHILLTALSVTMPASALRGLEGRISKPHGELAYSLVHEWLHSEDDGTLYELSREVEERLDLPRRLDHAEVKELLDGDIFPCIDECILRRYMAEISEDVVKAADIIAAVERRRTMKWYRRVSDYYDGLFQLARMQQFYQERPAGFHIAQYAQLWKEYCGELYKMDSYYRLFHAAFGRSLKEPAADLEDFYKNVAEYAERLYKNWFLAALGRQWTRLVREELAVGASLPEIPQQTDFYRRYVKPLTSGSGRAFVIISDALRYEVGADLAGRLLRETKGAVKLASMQAALPSVTKYGMAALLPHGEFRLTEDLGVACGGLSTSGTENREKVLQTAHPGNVALTYKALLAMKQSERREKISGAQVVYIYHNTIDAVGDKAITEDQVFAACEQAILEIKNLVRMIVGDMNGTNILITADHGFLYSYRPLEESEKLEKAILPEELLEMERRYAIVKKGQTAEHLLSIPMAHWNSECRILTPADAIRMKKSGGGMNYVHGGISLQEMAVPVIEYKNVRPTSKNYVDVKTAGLQLISQSRKISNSIFSLDFYQPEPVGGKVVAATYEIYMADATGKTVSDKQAVIADKTSKNGAERVCRVRLTLKGEEYRKTDDYYLMIVENGDVSHAEQAVFSIDIAFVNEFDF